MRFDPFDLTQVELHLGGTLVGLATVMIQLHQRHLAVAHLATEPPDSPKPKSSLDYLAAGLDFNRYLVVYLANPTTGMTGVSRAPHSARL